MKNLVEWKNAAYFFVFWRFVPVSMDALYLQFQARSIYYDFYGA